MRAAIIAGAAFVTCPALLTAQQSASTQSSPCRDARVSGSPPGPLDTLIATAMQRNNVPGAVVAVVRDGAVVMLAGYGCADVARGVPVDPARTEFRIASVSKLFVATAVMRLAESHEIDLNADVNGYLRDVRVPNAFGVPVTMHELLTHSAGFDERIVGYAARTPADIEPLGAYLSHRLPDRGWAPGTVTGYSNFGYALAGYVVEARRGAPFADVVEREIFQPLTMTRTTYQQPLPELLANDLATGYACTATGCTPAVRDYRSAYPPGGIVSTGGDMTHFMLAQLDGSYRGARVLGDSMLHVMHARQFELDAVLPGMTYGFAEDVLHGQHLLSHAGGVPGFSSLLTLVPDQRVGIFLSVNGGASRFGREALDAIANRFVQTSAADTAVPAAHLSGQAKPIGAYRLTRYAHRTIENFPLLFQGQLHVLDAPGDSIEIAGLGDADGLYVPVGATQWRRATSNDLIAFRTDASGKVTHLFGSLSFFGTRFPSAFERLPWYDTQRFVNEGLSWLLLLPLIVLAGVWPLTAGVLGLVRRRAVSPPTMSRPAAAWLAVAAAAAFTALFLLFGFGFLAQTVRAAEQGGGELIYAMPARMVMLARIPWVLCVLAAALVLAAIAGLRKRWWSWPGRVYMVVLAADAMCVIAFLLRWHMIPPRW